MRPLAEEREQERSPVARQKPKVQPAGEKPRKLLNKEKAALIELPKQIEKMEAERDRIASSMQEADYYRNKKNDPESDQSKLEQLENEILRAYETWEKLETLA